MSWDIVIFSSKQKIVTLEDLDENLLVPIDFDSILENHFDNVSANGNYREIKGVNYSIDYYTGDDLESNKLFSLYGEPALFELMMVARQYDWQIFDTGNGEMLDLDHPEKNGYQEFQNYLEHVLKSSNVKSGK